MNRFLYLHIPKTGGVTFRSIIENATQANRILHLKDPNELLKRSEEELRCYDFIHGHLGVNKIPGTLNHKKITTLRSPVERCISTYAFWRGQNPDQLDWSSESASKIRAAKELELLDLACSTDFAINKSFNNLQTRLLSGAPKREPILDRSHLQRAIENLGKMDFYAINSRLEESIDIFCFKFGLFRPQAIQRLNTSVHPGNISAETIERLQTLNALDMELLEWAEDNFPSQVINLPSPIVETSQPA